MGNYIAKQDILEQIPESSLIQLTDDEGIGTVNDARVTAAIDGAEGEADGYLSTRYAVPLIPVPEVVKKFTTDIAVYNLFARKDSVPPDREKRYENAVKFFTGVSKRLVSLGKDAPKEEAQSASPDTESSERLFTRSKMKGF